MPYIVTTKASRRAVATLDEARAVIRDHVVNAGVAHGTTADPITNSGGTVGPLPDGTVIEVRPVAVDELAGAVFDRDDYAPYFESDIIDAYNERQ